MEYNRETHCVFFYLICLLMINKTYAADVKISTSNRTLKEGDPYSITCLSTRNIITFIRNNVNVANVGIEYKNGPCIVSLNVQNYTCRADRLAGEQRRHSLFVNSAEYLPSPVSWQCMSPEAQQEMSNTVEINIFNQKEITISTPTFTEEREAVDTTTSTTSENDENHQQDVSKSPNIVLWASVGAVIFVVLLIVISVFIWYSQVKKRKPFKDLIIDDCALYVGLPADGTTPNFVKTEDREDPNYTLIGDFPLDDSSTIANNKFDPNKIYGVVEKNKGNASEESETEELTCNNDQEYGVVRKS